jgi:DNA-binding transcriptional LysR family regulator
MDAAVQGSGVALTNLFAVERHIEAGKLVALPFEAPSSRGLALRPTGAGVSEAADRFVSWLKLEIRRGAARLRGTRI